DQSPDHKVGLILGRGLIDEKRYVEALDLCDHEVMSQKAWPLLVDLQSHAFTNHEFEISGRAGALAFAAQADPKVAYNVGCAFARSGNSSQALVWLECAIASGFSDKNLLATDADLESIRSHSGFADLLNRN